MRQTASSPKDPTVPGVDRAAAIAAGGPVIAAMLGILAFQAAYPNAVYEVGPIDLSLVLAGLVAMYGWRRKIMPPSSMRYLVWAVPFSVWTVIASIAAWRPDALYLSATLGIWFVFLIPGLATVLR